MVCVGAASSQWRCWGKAALAAGVFVLGMACLIGIASSAQAAWEPLNPDEARDLWSKLKTVVRKPETKGLRRWAVIEGVPITKQVLETESPQRCWQTLRLAGG